MAEKMVPEMATGKEGGGWKKGLFPGLFRQTLMEQDTDPWDHWAHCRSYKLSQNTAQNIYVHSDTTYIYLGKFLFPLLVERIFAKHPL